MLTLLALASVIASQDTMRTIVDPELGMEFKVPKVWTYKKERKKPHQFSFTTASGTQAQVEVFSATYGAELERWQAVQANIAKVMGRTLARQWEEELLGVPLALTHTKFQAEGQENQSISGLLYNRSVRKLLVTLKAPTEGFQDAEIQWRTMLQTVHTASGQLPQVESPNRPILPDELKPVSTKPPKVTVYREEAQKPVLAAQALPYKVGGQDCLLYVPANWKIAGTLDNLRMTHPELPSAINVSLNSILDSDPADKALSKAGRASLDFFSTVNRRDDEAVKNSALALVSLVTRVGIAGGTACRAFDAVGVTGDNYWLLKYRIQGDWTPAQKLRFYDLISKMSLERVK